MVELCVNVRALPDFEDLLASHPDAISKPLELKKLFRLPLDTPKLTRNWD